MTQSKPLPEPNMLTLRQVRKVMEGLCPFCVVPISDEKRVRHGRRASDEVRMYSVCQKCERMFVT